MNSADVAKTSGFRAAVVSYAARERLAMQKDMSKETRDDSKNQAMTNSLAEKFNRNAVAQPMSFTPLVNLLERNDKRNLVGLIVGTGIAGIVTTAMEGFTNVIVEWAAMSPYLAPVGQALQVSIMGSTLNVPAILGVLFYVAVAILALTVVVYGLVLPFLPNDDNEK